MPISCLHVYDVLTFYYVLAFSFENLRLFILLMFDDMKVKAKENETNDNLRGEEIFVFNKNFKHSSVKEI